MSLKAPKRPPIADRIESQNSAHGEHWVDFYAWLRPDNWQEVIEDPAKLPPPIADYLKAENEYYDRATAHLAPLHDELAAEIRGRMAPKPESIPVTDGAYKYRFRYEENAEYPLRVRNDLNGNTEEIVFDVAAAADGFEYFDFGQIDHSPDHTKLLWTSDTSGAEFFTLYIRDIASGVDKDYCIENVYDAVWADDQTIFYTHRDSAHRILTVYKHVLDSNPENDILIFSEKDKFFGCGVCRSRSRDYIFIMTSTFEQDEWWYVPVNDLNAPPALIQARQDRLEYGVDHQGDSFIITTNADDAIDWKIIETPINAASMQHWTDLIAHQPGQMIEDVDVLKHWIVWLEIVNALPQIAYMDNSGNIKRVKFDEEAYSLELFDVCEFESHCFVFEYSSPTTPSEYFEFNMQTAERTLLKRQLIPSGHEPKDYVTRRFSVESHDGAQVPVTLLYRHDTLMDGTAPAFLYGYGSYGSSSYAEFSYDLLSLVDRGFVYAIAHVRGGSEKGMAWHEDSKLERKTNSFHDFIAVGDALVTQKYCAEGKIVSLGESAGGLLVGASMHMKPELFAGVIADVPDVDVLTIMLDATLPGIPEHWPLWGNPGQSKSIFDTIKGYSPYENTKAEKYPSLFVTSGVSDPRVVFWQPAKWVAKLRSLKTDNNIILFKTNMQSGHFGKTGRWAQIDDTAAQYVFAISVVSD